MLHAVGWAIVMFRRRDHNWNSVCSDHLTLLRGAGPVKGKGLVRYLMAEHTPFVCVNELVKLQSSEGEVFEVSLEVAKVSRTLSTLLAGKVYVLCHETAVMWQDRSRPPT